MTVTCCEASMPPAGCDFCPRCGRRTGRLAEGTGQQINLGPSETDFNYILRNEGSGELPYRISVPTPDIELIGEDSGKLLGNKERSIHLRIKSNAPASITASLIVWPRDAPRRDWWQKDEEREVRIPLSIRRQQAATLEVLARVLLFPDNAPTQRLIVYNCGDEAAQATLQVPAAYTVSATKDFPGTTVLPLTVPAQSLTEAWVTRSTAAVAVESLEVFCGTKRTTVELRPLQARGRSVFNPDHVIGIDFGTRNTSIRLRSIANGDADPISIGPERFPSVLFINPLYPKAPLIGDDALGAWNDPTQPDGAFLVESIKTLVRMQEERYLQYGPEWTVANLLQIYMTALRKMILASMQSEEIEDENNILYVFTLPVLDGGALYEQQEQRMRQAAVKAGFPDAPDLTWMIPEPHAAALQVVHRLPSLAAEGVVRTGLKPGTRLCVVDAGGGTTDVCIGEVKIDNTGRYHFTPQKADALHRTPSTALQFFLKELYPAGNNRRLAPQDQEVGGNVIDYEIAYQSIPDGGQDQEQFVAEPWLLLFPAGDARSAPSRVERFLAGIRTLKHDLSNAPSQLVDLQAEAENGQEEYLNYFVRGEQVDDLFNIGHSIFDYSADVKPVIEKIWADPNYGPYLTQIAADGCDYVVPIGGTTLIPETLQQMRRYTGAELAELRPKERMTAVAEGAVWAFDARLTKALPFDLSLHMTLGDTVVSRHLLAAYQPLTSISAFNPRFDVLPDDHVVIELIAADAEGPTAFASMALKNIEGGWFRVQASSIDDKAFRLSMSGEDGTLKPIWEVYL